MQHALLNPRETIAALLIVALGAFALYEGTGHEVGSLARMGPGYFPALVGSILIALGTSLLLVFFLSGHTPLPDFPLRGLLFVAAGISAFALLLERAGLIPATLAIVVLTSLADRSTGLVTIAINAAFLSVAGVVVFIWGLRLPLLPIDW